MEPYLHTIYPHTGRTLAAFSTPTRARNHLRARTAATAAYPADPSTGDPGVAYTYAQVPLNPPPPDAAWLAGGWAAGARAYNGGAHDLHTACGGRATAALPPGTTAYYTALWVPELALQGIVAHTTEAGQARWEGAARALLAGMLHTVAVVAVAVDGGPVGYMPRVAAA